MTIYPKQFYRAALPARSIEPIEQGQVGSGLPAGPVLLVDDIVDSGWTLAAAGSLLLSNGVPAVHPFALAMTRGG